MSPWKASAAARRSTMALPRGGASMGHQPAHRGTRLARDVATGSVHRMGLLQWGHGNVAVESTYGIELDDARGAASMGPRQCRRGKPEPSLPSPPARRG